LISNIFGNAPVITGYNEVLLSDLTRSIYQWPYSCVRIGAIFIKVCPPIATLLLQVDTNPLSLSLSLSLSLCLSVIVPT
jgi:hypothetical protein